MKEGRCFSGDRGVVWGVSPGREKPVLKKFGVRVSKWGKKKSLFKGKKKNIFDDRAGETQTNMAGLKGGILY